MYVWHFVSPKFSFSLMAWLLLPLCATKVMNHVSPIRNAVGQEEWVVDTGIMMVIVAKIYAFDRLHLLSVTRRKPSSYSISECPLAYLVILLCTVWCTAYRQPETIYLVLVYTAEGNEKRIKRSEGYTCSLRWLSMLYVVSLQWILPVAEQDACDDWRHSICCVHALKWWVR